MQLVTAQGYCLPGFDTLAELGENIGQVSVGHLILPVADGLADAVSAIIAHARHDAAGKGGKRIAPHVEVDAVMKEFLARRRVGLFAVAERQLHVLALLFLERHTIAALGLQDHFFCIFHAVSILIRIPIFSSLRSASVPRSEGQVSGYAARFPFPAFGGPPRCYR